MADESGGTHDPAHNRQLDADLEADLRAEDPTRYVHRNSGTGDGHIYAGWYFGRWEDFAFRPGGPFVTEYGSLAPPDEATLREIIPADAIGYDSPAARRTWAFHDFQHDETRTNIGVLPSVGLERYVAAAQAYQANLLQVATEAYRRGRAARPGGLPADGGPLITGIQQFMAVEGWESMTWAVLDHLRRPKPGYYALARAMAPLLVSAELLDGRSRPAPRPRSGRVIRLRGWLINDLPEPVPPATLRWTIRPIADPSRAAAGDATLDGWNGSDTPAAITGELAVAGVPADSSTILGETEVRLVPGWCRIELRLQAADDRMLATNHLDVEVRR
jgi:beta-mannosidase